MGGDNETSLMNDVWRWHEHRWLVSTPQAEWSARSGHASVALRNATVLVLGGWNGSVVLNDVWMSGGGTGMGWEQVTAAAEWSARDGHAALVLPGTAGVLMFGGSENGTEFAAGLVNDVWLGEDGGAVWSRVLHHAEWSPRSEHVALVLPGGALVVAGGWDGVKRTNDVWRSIDSGASWQESTPSAPWLAREGHAALVLASGDLLLMGGTVDWDGVEYRSDVWRSGDGGLTWLSYATDAPWAARSGHVSVVLPDGDILLSGGAASAGIANDVWRSNDGGRKWRRMTPAAEWAARYDHAGVVLSSGDVLVLGGWNDVACTHDVWRSSDGGVSWQLVANQTRWSPRYAHKAVVAAGTSGDVVIITGGACDEVYQNDVWASSDGGSTWRVTNAAAAWPARDYHGFAALSDGALLVTGGWDGARDLRDVWRSPDGGATWTLLTANAEWPARYGHTHAVLPNGDVLLVGGNGPTLPRDVWRSSDGGATWQPVLAELEWKTREYHSTVVLPDGSVLLLGGWDGARRKNDVWRTRTVGTRWRAIDVRAPWPARHGHASTTWRDEANGDRPLLLMLGGAIDAAQASGDEEGGGGGAAFAADCWASPDGGLSWEEEGGCVGAAANMWSPRAGHSAVTVAAGTVVVVLGGRNEAGYLSDVWTTANGSLGAWQQAAPATGAWLARAHGAAAVAVDGSTVMLMGGRNASHSMCDVWRGQYSPAGGGGGAWAWALASVCAEWGPRHAHSAVTLGHGEGGSGSGSGSVLLLVGGRRVDGTYLGDAWRSDDVGTTWAQVHAGGSGFAPRCWHALTVVDVGGVVVLLGGVGVGGAVFGDVWQSADNGTSWQQVVPAAEWRARAGHSAVSLPSTSTTSSSSSSGGGGGGWPGGALLVWGGASAARATSDDDDGFLLDGSLPDAWRSDDGGRTWRALPLMRAPAVTTRQATGPDDPVVVMTSGWGGGSWARAFRTVQGNASLEERVENTMEWAAVSVTPSSGGGHVVLAPFGPDQLVHVRLPFTSASTSVLPLMNPLSVAEAWTYVAAELPEGLEDAAATPLVRRLVGAGLLLCGGRVDSHFMSACWWVGSGVNGSEALCAGVGTCGWGPRHSAALATSSDRALGTQLVVLFGGVGARGRYMADLWLSESGATTWREVALPLHIASGRAFVGASVGFLEHLAPPAAALCKDTAIPLRVLAVGGVSAQFELANTSLRVDLCVDAVRGTVGVAPGGAALGIDATVSELPLPLQLRSFGGHAISLPSGVLCVFGGRTAYTVPAVRSHVHCSADGEAWQLLAGAAETGQASEALSVGMGASYFAPTQELVAMGGQSRTFAGRRVPVVVRAEPRLGAADVVVAWSTRYLAPVPVTRASWRCALAEALTPATAYAAVRAAVAAPPGPGGEVAATSVPADAAFQVHLPLPQTALNCPHALVQACVESARWNGSICGAATQVRLPLTAALPQHVVVMQGFELELEAAVAMVCVNASVVVLHSSATGDAVPPPLNVTWVPTCFDGRRARVPLRLHNALDLRDAYALRVLAFRSLAAAPLAVVTVPLPAVQCPAGWYLLHETTGRCAPCPTGSYAPSPWLGTACLPCAAGTYASRLQSESCLPCDPGEYAEEGTSACVKCPDLKTTAAAGAGTSVAKCGCPHDMVRIADGTCTSCRGWLFVDCSRNFNVTLREVNTTRGYWRHASRPDEGDECLASAVACVGGPLGRGCASGHGGRLCMECEAAGGWVFTGKSAGDKLPCMYCSDGTRVRAAIGLALLLLGAAVALWALLTERGAMVLWSATARLMLAKQRQKLQHQEKARREQQTGQLALVELPNPLVGANGVVVDEGVGGGDAHAGLGAHADAEEQESAELGRAAPRGRGGVRAPRCLKRTAVRAAEHARKHSAFIGLWWRSSTILMQLVSVGLTFTQQSFSNDSGARADSSTVAVKTERQHWLATVLVDLQGFVATGCVSSWLTSPYGRLTVAICTPVVLCGVCGLAALRHARYGNVAIGERALWLLTTLAALTVTNAQMQSLSAFACRRLSFDDQEYLMSDPSMPCFGTRYLGLQLLAAVGAIGYCVAFPLATFFLLQHASHKGHVPVWLLPLTSGMDARKAALEVVGLVQRSVVVACFVFFSQRSFVEDGRIRSTASSLGAVGAALLQLVVAFTLLSFNPFSSRRAQRAFMIVHYASTLCMLQLAVMPYRGDWTSTPQAVTASIAVGVLCIGVAVFVGDNVHKPRTSVLLAPDAVAAALEHERRRHKERARAAGEEKLGGVVPMHHARAN